MDERVFKLGELFCGPGGIGIAAKKAIVRSENTSWKISHSWATDYDRDSCITYQKNILPERKKAVVREDIRKLNFDKLNNIAEVDSLAFGFPCNDFSVVGEQKGMNGAFGPLYKYAVKGLNKFKPKWFFAENVGGLRNSDEGKALKKVLSEFIESGYNIFPHLYKFEEYGIPQARHRIIIIGIRKDLDVEFGIPRPNYETKTAREAIEEPPIEEDAPNHVYTNQSETVIKRLKHIKPGENAFTADIPEHLQLNVKGAQLSHIYKRLEAEKPAYTITGSGGGGTHTYHWEENRALTNRERARLQTFPDEFIFYGGKGSIRKQIGMAVPVEGARIILESVLKSFAGIKYDTIPPNIERPTKNLFGGVSESKKYYKNA